MYKKVFASRQEAMQQKSLLNLPNLYQFNNEVIFVAPSPTEEYPDMVEFSVTADDIYTEIKEQPNHAKIYRWVLTPQSELTVAPIDHDYTSGLSTTLFAKRIFEAGELQRVDWFSDEALTDLVLQTEITYERNLLGFAVRRTTTRTWFLETGEPASPQKVTVKRYDVNLIDQMEEGITRRGNLINTVTMNTLGMMLATIPGEEGESEQDRQSRILIMGREFLALHKKQFRDFVEDSNKELLGTITKAQEFWMKNLVQPGVTIRDYILSELSKV